MKTIKVTFWTWKSVSVDSYNGHTLLLIVWRVTLVAVKFKMPASHCDVDSKTIWTQKTVGSTVTTTTVPVWKSLHRSVKFGEASITSILTKCEIWLLGRLLTLLLLRWTEVIVVVKLSEVVVVVIVGRSEVIIVRPEIVVVIEIIVVKLSEVSLSNCDRHTGYKAQAQ